jgi:hypothetical protein
MEIIKTKEIFKIQLFLLILDAVRDHIFFFFEKTLATIYSVNHLLGGVI